MAPIAPIERDTDFIHPAAREKFLLLLGDLERGYRYGETKTQFKIFETFRHPSRQLHAKLNGVSRASLYESAHSLGLAVDFVPMDNGRWSWDMNHDWAYLRARATARGLLNEIEWDRAHVEYPYWQDVWDILKRIPRG